MTPEMAYPGGADVTQRQLRGNLPQAFVHALMLECAAQEHAGMWRSIR